MYFLPSVIFQLEEYGLPRTISKRIHKQKVINLIDDTNIHKAIDDFNRIGIESIIEKLQLKEFDIYILKYFYDGIKSD